jgi:hypothetical protein
MLRSRQLKRTCTFAPVTMHVLQRMHRDCNACSPESEDRGAPLLGAPRGQQWPLSGPLIRDRTDSSGVGQILGLYATEATHRLLAFGFTSWACTRSPPPVTPRIALQSRFRRRTACIRKEFFATTFMSGASGEIDSCSASLPDRFLSEFASHAGGYLPGILAHLVQVPGDRYAHSDEM